MTIRGYFMDSKSTWFYDAEESYCGYEIAPFVLSRTGFGWTQ